MTEPRWQKLLWEATDEAITASVDPITFMKEVRDCWREAHRQEAKRSDEIFKDAISRAQHP